ncbi:hypothetical protein N9Y17_04900, partial [Gammaproteobacteria bacterium]|nr:hypothetical protein [Gammaproteobacteria bacterium]
MYVYAIYLLPIACLAVLLTAIFSNKKNTPKEPDIEKQLGTPSSSSSSSITSTSNNNTNTNQPNDSQVEEYPITQLIKKCIETDYIRKFIPEDLLNNLHNSQSSDEESQFIDACLSDSGIEDKVKDLLREEKVTLDKFRKIIKPPPPPRSSKKIGTKEKDNQPSTDTQKKRVELLASIKDPNRLKKTNNEKGVRPEQPKKTPSNHLGSVEECEKSDKLESKIKQKQGLSKESMNQPTQPTSLERVISTAMLARRFSISPSPVKTTDDSFESDWTQDDSIDTPKDGIESPPPQTRSDLSPIHPVKNIEHSEKNGITTLPVPFTPTTSNVLKNQRRQFPKTTKQIKNQEDSENQEQ